MKKSRQHTIPSTSVITAVLTLLFCLVSCGGGTTGTGGTGSDFRGIVVSEDAIPISGVAVTLEESGDSSKTDVKGAWSIQTSYNAQTATLLVEDKDIQVRTAIADLPDGPKDVEVTLNLNKTEKKVQITKQKVTKKEVTPAPTVEVPATPIPGMPDTPAPLPTSEPIPGATATPTNPPVTVPPTATATPNATATPLPPTPTPIPMTNFHGVVRSSNNALVKNARIRIVQVQAGMNLRANGIFQFSAPAAAKNRNFAYLPDTRRVTFTVPEINENSTDVTLNIQVEEDGAGNLTITVLEAIVR